MESHNKIIQLILPNQKIIKINLSGDEKELKELISEIAGISPSQIKGIKDSNYNYYTISSAIKNQHLLKTKEVCYELVLGKENLKNSFLRNSAEYPDNNKMVLNTTPNVGNYIANYYINGFRKNNTINNHEKKNHYLSKSFNSTTFQSLKDNDFNLINSYLFQLLTYNKINKEQYSELVNLINKEQNVNLINLFKNKFSGKIDKVSFMNILITYTNNKDLNENQEIPLIKPKIQQSIKINSQMIDFENKVKIYEKMKDYFNDDDIEIIRISLKYENESIMKAIKIYKNNGILSSLIMAFKKAIERYKKKYILFGEKGQYLFSTRKIDFEDQNKSEDYKNKVKRFKSSEKNRYLNKEQRHSMNENKAKLLKAFSESNSSNKNQNKQIIKKVKKLLKKNNKPLFEYIVKFFPEEYKSIEEMYQKNIDNENLEKILNEKCERFLDKEIMNYSKSNGSIILNSDLEIFHNLSNENDTDVQCLFNEFEIQLNFSDFINQICEFIMKLKEKKEKEIIQSFIKDLKKINLNENDNFTIKEKIKKKSSKIFNIINKYKENSNIFLYKDEINMILKRNENKKKEKEKEKVKDKNKDKKKQDKKTLKIIELNKQKHYYDEIFNDLKEKFLFTSDQLDILQNNYKKDEKLQKILSNYFYKNLTIDKIKIEIEKYIQSKNKSISNIIQIKQIFSTPEGIKKSKIELNCFLHEPEDNKIIIKQKEIISLLYKENCLDKETYEIIHKKIEQDEHALIAAFEVYAVTQDHIEFIETLSLISELYLNYKECFYILLNNSSFNNYQKDLLENLFREKNKKLIQALEKYKLSKDKEFIFEIFNKLISNND